MNRPAPSMVTTSVEMGSIEVLLMSKRLSQFVGRAKDMANNLGLKRSQLTIAELDDGTVRLRFEAFVDE